MTTAKIKSIAPWFGGKRTLAPTIVEELGPHSQYFEPFCGSMAVLMAKPPSAKETVCDLHCDLINLAKVIQQRNSAELLYERLCGTLFSESILNEARVRLQEDDGVAGLYADPEHPPRCADLRMSERAYWYFLASWMGRGGVAGTERLNYQIAVRWTNNGGSPTVRFHNTVQSLPWWHQRLLNVVILCRDAFRIVDRFEDAPSTAIYVDPPYLPETRSFKKNGQGSRYLHEFDHGEPEEDGQLFPKMTEQDDHERLRDILIAYRRARIVVSYYDCPRSRELYEGWTFLERYRTKHLQCVGGSGGPKKSAPEVLILNGPSLTTNY